MLQPRPGATFAAVACAFGLINSPGQAHAPVGEVACSLVANVHRMAPAHSGGTDPSVNTRTPLTTVSITGQGSRLPAGLPGAASRQRAGGQAGRGQQSTDGWRVGRRMQAIVDRRFAHAFGKRIAGLAAAPQLLVRHFRQAAPTRLNPERTGVQRDHRRQRRQRR